MAPCSCSSMRTAGSRVAQLFRLLAGPCRSGSLGRYPARSSVQVPKWQQVAVSVAIVAGASASRLENEAVLSGSRAGEGHLPSSSVFLVDTAWELSKCACCGPVVLAAPYLASLWCEAGWTLHWNVLGSKSEHRNLGGHQTCRRSTLEAHGNSRIWRLLTTGNVDVQDGSQVDCKTMWHGSCQLEFPGRH